MSKQKKEITYTDGKISEEDLLDLIDLYPPRNWSTKRIELEHLKSLDLTKDQYADLEILFAGYAARRYRDNSKNAEELMKYTKTIQNFLKDEKLQKQIRIGVEEGTLRAEEVIRAHRAFGR